MQGTVYRMDRNMAMIWTEDNFLVRITARAGLSLGNTVSFSTGDLIQPSRIRQVKLSYHQISILIAGIFLALAILLMSIQGLAASFTLPPATASGAVDINPSVLFSVAQDGTVVSVKAQNEDARKLKLSLLRGQDFESALTSLVHQVTQAGIIDG